MTVLLAHQGGWDEIVLFLVPAVGAILLVRWAERRARRNRDDEDPETGISMAPPETRRPGE